MGTICSITTVYFAKQAGSLIAQNLNKKTAPAVVACAVYKNFFFDYNQIQHINYTIITIC
jgi:hypothetical protein